MSKQYNQRFVALSAATSTSTSTSPAFYVGDFRLVSLSIETSNTTSSSTFIIQGSNADGLRSGDLAANGSQSTGWSNITIVLPGSLNVGGNVGRGVFTFDPPGYRWMRSATSADGQLNSLATVVFYGESF